MSITRERQIPESTEVRDSRGGRAHRPTLEDPLIAICGERLLGISARPNIPRCEQCEHLMTINRWVMRP